MVSLAAACGGSGSQSGSHAAVVPAGRLVAGLKCAGLPITQTQVYTERSDPNHELGRPNGYTSKANWVDARIDHPSGDFDPEDGGSVEVFGSSSDAQVRLKYLRSLSNAGAFGTNEYDWILDGQMLLRVTNTLVPSDAAVYRKTAERLLADPKAIGQDCHAPAQPKAPAPRDALASQFIGGNFSPSLPAGPANKVSVIAYGPYDGVDLPVIIRNMTPDAVTDLKVSATAMQGSTVVATGADQGFAPPGVGPGDIALGYVYFNNKRLPSGVHIRFHVESTPLRQSYGVPGSLAIVSTQHVGSQITGYAKNLEGSKVTGPLTGLAVCFDQGGRITREHQTFLDQNSVPPHARAPYSIDLTDLGSTSASCSLYLVAVYGFRNG